MSAVEALASEPNIAAALKTEGRADKVSKELDDTINTKLQALVHTIEATSEAPYAGSDVDEHKQVVNLLWVIKAGFLEIGSLCELGDVDTALDQLSRVTEKVQGFAEQYPDAMLVPDLQRRLQDMNTKINQLIVDSWNNVITLNETAGGAELKVRGGDPVSLNAAFLVTRSSVLNDFLKKFESSIDRIIALDVSQVEESDNVLKISYGRVKTIDDLIYVVQSLVLELETVLGPYPRLFSTIATRYGRYMIEGLTQKSFPALFPTDKSQLAGFKRELQGVKGLEDILKQLGWLKGASDLSDLADNFVELWENKRETHFLGQLRDILAGTVQLPPDEQEESGDGWGWDGAEVEEEGDTTGANGEKDTYESTPTKVHNIMKAAATETGNNIDSLLALYRALAPGHYSGHPLLLYADTKYLLHQVSDYPVSERAKSLCLQVVNSQLSSIVHSASEDIDGLVEGVDYAKPAQQAKRIVEYIGAMAERASVTEPAVRIYILEQLVEQVAHQIIAKVEEMPDISEERCNELSGLIKNLKRLRAYFDDIDAQVPSWIKLQRLNEILSSNLVQIRHLLDASMLLDFSASELSELVTALFVDSQKRQSLIETFQRSQLTSS